MFQSIRKHWRHFVKRPPGRRFKTFYKERQKKRGSKGTGKKWLLIVIGIVVTVAGVALLPLPGPGSIVVVAGLAFLSSQSLTMARFLDVVDKRRAIIMSKLRRIWRSSTKAKCLLIAGGTIPVLVALGVAVWFWLKA
jgi:hypothetical protein